MQQIEVLEEAEMASLLDQQALCRFRDRALRPDQPKVLGAAQNADVYFQGREVSNRFYDRVPEWIEAVHHRPMCLTT